MIIYVKYNVIKSVLYVKIIIIINVKNIEIIE